MSEGSTSCFGRYCGFQPDPNNTGQWLLDECGACPRGYRTNETKYCEKCETPPTAYDWLYLGFLALLPCMLHWIYILKNNGEVKLLTIQLIVSFSECVTAAFLSLISMEPQGELNLVSCPVERLSDWYTMFYNPQIRYTTTIHCTQEAVYPLVTIGCIYYAYTLVLMLLFRPLLLSFWWRSKMWRDPVYAALYFHPILVIAEAFLGGLLYYSFPYLTVIVSLVALAAYFVWTEVTSLSAVKMYLFRNIMITLWHFALLAYGAIAISMTNFYYIFIVPVPLVFYFGTVKFTDPENIVKEWQHGD